LKDHLIRSTRIGVGQLRRLNRQPIIHGCDFSRASVTLRLRSRRRIRLPRLSPGRHTYQYRQRARRCPQILCASESQSTFHSRNETLRSRMLSLNKACHPEVIKAIKDLCNRLRSLPSSSNPAARNLLVNIVSNFPHPGTRRRRKVAPRLGCRSADALFRL
jgi:hypothetical protein